MDVLYVHPAKQEVDARYDQYKASGPYPIMPVGVVGLMNELEKNGIVLQGLNLPLELLLLPGFSFRDWLRVRERPTLVMADLHWYEHSYGAIEVARAVKEVWPRVPVVLGGLTASRYGGEILRHFPSVSYVIQGDAEEPLLKLVSRLMNDQEGDLADVPNLIYRHGGSIESNRLTYTAAGRELDAIDYASTSWLEHERSYAAMQYSGAGEVDLGAASLRGHWLTVGRGCVFDCAYCGGGKMAHRTLARRDGYVMRSPEAVVRDMQRLRDRDIHQVSFSLDIATFGPRWWRELFGLLKREGLFMGLYNEFFQLPSAAFVKAFAEVADLRHTEVALSPLSGDERVRRLNGKYFDNESLMTRLEVLRQHRVPIFVYFSLNLPQETRRAFRKTLALAKEIGAFYPDDLLRMINTCHTLDPASPMAQDPDGFDIDVHYRNFEDYYNYARGTRWQPRRVVRGQHRGFEMPWRPAEAVEEMAKQWDRFAKSQAYRCFAVPRGW